MQLYRMIDKNGKSKLSRNLLSFSRPIFFHKKPEGLIFDFIKTIDYRKELENIKYDKNIAKKILKIYDSYLESMNIEANEENRMRHFSEMEIMFFMYLNTYCCYCTNADLNDKQTKKKYFNKNRRLINKYKYIDCVSFELAFNETNCIKLISNTKCNDMVFEMNSSKDGILGYLHAHEIKYVEDISVDMIFDKFEENDRKLSSLFTYVCKEWSKQEEERLFIMLEGIKEGARKIASSFDDNNIYNTFEEKIYFYVVKTLKECAQKYPDFIYLKIDRYNLIGLD